MGKRALFVALFVLVCFTGCKKKDPRMLMEPENVVSIKDFSAFSDTEIQTETETPTEVPTEMATEPPTEPVTEEETEPAEQPYVGDFDFSDLNVLSAVFYKTGGIGSVPYENRITQDEQAMTRTQTVTTTDGKITVTFIADAYSGSSNRILIFDYSTENAVVELASMLPRLGYGINSENVDQFLFGLYNGPERAPLIGLEDTDVSVGEDGHYTVTLTKAKQPEGPVPYWQDGAQSNGELFRAERITVNTGTDIFGDLIRGLDFGRITLVNEDTQAGGIVMDEKGNILSGSSQYSCTYSSDSGVKYEITVNDVLSLSIITPDSLPDPAAMALAGHVYQYFFSGTLDVNYDLSVPFENEHCTVSKADTTVKIVLRKI